MVSQQKIFHMIDDLEKLIEEKQYLESKLNMNKNKIKVVSIVLKEFIEKSDTTPSELIQNKLKEIIENVE